MTQEAPEGKGVRVFPPPPKGFDPFTATKIEPTRHGLPPRPDRQTLPVQAALWEHIARRYGSFEHLQPKLSSPDTPRVLATTEAGPFALDGFESCGYELFSSAPFLTLAATWTVPNLEYKTNPFGPNQIHTFLGLGFLDGNDCRCRPERHYCGYHPHRRASRPSGQPRRCDERRPVLAR